MAAIDTPQDRFSSGTTPVNVFNNEEMEKLRNLLKQLEPQVVAQDLNKSSYSFVQLGNIQALSASNNPYLNTWIIDLGPSDRMTNYSNSFST